MRTRVLALIAIGSLLLLAGCGGDDEGDGERTAETTPETTEAEAAAPTEPRSEPGTTIKTGDSQFGQVLFDGDDQAVYYFDKETSSESECYGACAEAWPPVLTEGDPRAGQGAQAGQLGTTERDDGTTQVTYDGRPLYYYDEPAGEVRCHNVPGFGGLWLAVQPNGQAVPT